MQDEGAPVRRTAAAALAASASPAELRWRGQVLRDWLRGALARELAREVEQRRLFPWLPVAFGSGILLFFSADEGATLWAPLSAAILAGAGAVALRAKLAAFIPLVALCALFAGFAAGVLRLRAVEAPVLQRVVIGVLQGHVETLDQRLEGGRLVIRVHGIEGVEAGALPRRVRVSVREVGPLAPGQFIAARARLLPLPEAVRPGGYDFGRDAYFRGIGAVGSLIAKPEIRPTPVGPGLALRIAAAVDDARNRLTRRIADGVGGPAGAVTAALVTGKRGLIDEETNDILRGSGIYHIVSISGLHMVLAAGAFFAGARALLALIPFAALRWPIKKIAAVVAMAGATAYCIFAGAEVATERSLVMTLVMLGAVLVDRPALSLRNLAIAALIVLAREPETLLGPSFQMSFAAVAALIALAAAALKPVAVVPADHLGRAGRWIGRALLAMLATTLVAGLATAPFGAYHFQTANPLGIVGNALALPLVTLVVMPAALLGVLALPFGLDAWVWWGTGAAVAKVLAVSDWVSGLSGATVAVPAMSTAALACFALALLVATLPASGIRIACVIPLMAGTVLAGRPDRVDILIDRGGQGAAVRASDGRLAFAGRVSGFVGEQWLRADGDERPPDDLSLTRAARCDGLGCVVRSPLGALSVVLDPRAFEEDCRRAAVIVSRLTAPPGCRARHVFDGPPLARTGAVAITMTETGPRIATVREALGAKPWLTRPPPARVAPRQPERRPSPDPDLDGRQEDPGAQ